MRAEMSSARQGSPARIRLRRDCRGAGSGQVVGGVQMSDIDDDPLTFSFSTRGLELGTHQLVFNCPDGPSLPSKLLIFRQNGGERGEANSTVLLTTVGLASTAASVALPTLVQPMSGGQRRLRRRKRAAVRRRV